MRAKPNMITTNYLKYVAQSHTFVSNVESRSYGISYPAITAGEVANTKIPLPSTEEQQHISVYLDSKCNEIDASIKDKMIQVKILDDYKKTLIYEYVTGKKEVPQFAG